MKHSIKKYEKEYLIAIDILNKKLYVDVLIGGVCLPGSTPRDRYGYDSMYKH